jgi:hypothetical protein
VEENLVRCGEERLGQREKEMALGRGNVRGEEERCWS